MATTWIKPLHKGGSIASALSRSADYVKDKSKTEDGKLVDSYECQPYTAQSEFLLSKKLYAQKTGRDQGKNDVIAYHIRMSFKPGEVTAEKALELGRELAMRWTRGKHQFIVAAHTNIGNPHVHIIYNSVTLDCDRKYKDFLHSYKALRRVSDLICLEHGLAVVENPGLSKGYNRAEYLHGRDGGGDGSVKPPSVRDQLRDIIDTQMEQIISAQRMVSQSEKSTAPQDTAALFEQFLTAMKSAGCEVKRGKHLAFKIPGGQRFIRCKSLGEDYEEAALLERIIGVRVVEAKERKSVQSENFISYESVPQDFSPQLYNEDTGTEIVSRPAPPKRQPTTPSQPKSPPTITQPTQTKDKPNLLINIQAKLQKAHSPGFEHFARLYNLKEMTKTLLFLQERGLAHYDTLIEKSNAVSISFGKRCDRIKVIEARQKEISELQKHIGTYSKTKDVLAEYNKLKNAKPPKPSALTNIANLIKQVEPKSPAQQFYEENESAIIRCRAAKNYFDEQGYGNATGKKLPTIKTLQTEYATLEAERKKLWSGHKSEREEMVALKMAKQNVDTFLSEPKSPQISKSYEHGR